MKILMIGDVVGKPGRTAVLDRLQDLKEQHAIENVAGGFSITRRWPIICSRRAST